MMIAATPGCPKVVSEKLYAVYVGDTGRIVHLHGVTVLEGGQEFSEAEIEEKALDHARAFLRTGEPAGLKARMISPDQFKPGHYHAIDLKTLEIVATPRETRQN